MLYFHVFMFKALHILYWAHRIWNFNKLNFFFFFNFSSISGGGGERVSPMTNTFLETSSNVLPTSPKSSSLIGKNLFYRQNNIYKTAFSNLYHNFYLSKYDFYNVQLGDMGWPRLFVLMFFLFSTKKQTIKKQFFSGRIFILSKVRPQLQFRA